MCSDSLRFASSVGINGLIATDRIEKLEVTEEDLLTKTKFVFF